ncbi:hypothetical protein EGW08_022176, partial [Elysia chlorotica]
MLMRRVFLYTISIAFSRSVFSAIISSELTSKGVPNLGLSLQSCPRGGSNPQRVPTGFPKVGSLLQIFAFGTPLDVNSDEIMAENTDLENAMDIVYRNTRLMSISGDRKFADHSFEELRLQDMDSQALKDNTTVTRVLEMVMNRSYEISEHLRKSSSIMEKIQNNMDELAFNQSKIKSATYKENEEKERGVEYRRGCFLQESDNLVPDPAGKPSSRNLPKTVSTGTNTLISFVSHLQNFGPYPSFPTTSKTSKHNISRHSEPKSNKNVNFLSTSPGSEKSSTASVNDSVAPFTAAKTYVPKSHSTLVDAPIKVLSKTPMTTVLKQETNDYNDSKNTSATNA